MGTTHSRCSLKFENFEKSVETWHDPLEVAARLAEDYRTALTGCKEASPHLSSGPGAQRL